MSVNTCRSCIPFDCSGYGVDDDIFSLYSLQQPPFLFVPNCPPGYACQDAPFLLLDCCGDAVVVDLIGVQEPQRSQKINAALTACAQKWEFCGGIGGGGVDPNQRRRVEIFYNEMATCIDGCSDGTNFTIQVAPGSSAARTLDAANLIASQYACRLARERKICLGALSLTSGCSSQSFTARVRARARVPVVFAVSSGSLPTGLTLSQNNQYVATISGTPTTPGTYTFKLKAVNGVGNWMEKEYTITIVGITTASVPDGTQNSFYSTTFASSGIGGQLTWAVTSGSLPAGLSLNSITGVLSGTPTSSGDFTFTIGVSGD